jgi:predicted metalloprotease
MRSWQIPATTAGFTLVRPKVTIYGDQVTTSCGNKPGVAAFYCTLNQQIYFSRLYPDRLTTLKTNPWAGDLTMAHEFGHAIQGRTGIWNSYDIIDDYEPDSSARLLLSRRMEAQADCFSGLFLRSVSSSIGVQQTDVPGVLDTFYAKGSDVLSKKPDIVTTHPRGASRRYWGQTGLGTAEVAKCNTFSAEASLVR